MAQLSLHSPYGELTLTEEDGALVALDWGRGRDQQTSPLLHRAAQQLHAYFDGERTAFELPLAPQGTAFQRRVWAYLGAIPYGATQSYGEAARALDTAPRAIGLAVGRNPLPIIIPCHRIIGADGRLTGYSGDGGLETKAGLLRLEGALACAA